MAEAAELPQKEEPPMRSRADFERYIDENAPAYGLSPAKVKAVVNCETGSTWNPKIVGDNGTSFGLAQLHYPEMKGLTIEEAENPKIALDYLMKNWSKDHWTCQRLLKI